MAFAAFLLLLALLPLLSALGETQNRANMNAKQEEGTMRATQLPALGGVTTDAAAGALSIDGAVIGGAAAGEVPV